MPKLHLTEFGKGYLTGACVFFTFSVILDAIYRKVQKEARKDGIKTCLDVIYRKDPTLYSAVEEAVSGMK